MEETTFDFRLQRKAVKEILSSRPEGMDKEELTKLAEERGIKGEEFQKVLSSLINSGRAYYDSSGKLHHVRNE